MGALEILNLRLGPTITMLEKSRKFPFITRDLGLFTCTSKHVHYCQKVAELTEIGSFLSTAQSSIVVAFKFTRKRGKTKCMVSLVQLYLCCHFYNRASENSRF